MYPKPTVIWTAPMRFSHRARQLAASVCVGGNHEGNALGRISMSAPMAAKAAAFRIFIG
jgi:hypothetical protein